MSAGTRKPMDSQEQWVKLRIRPEWKGAADSARLAGFKVRDRTADSMSIAVVERYWKRPPHLVTLLSLVDAHGAEGPGWERLPSWGGGENEIDQRLVDEQVRLRLEAGTPAGVWSAWRLAVLSNSDERLPSTLREFNALVGERQPGSSLWLVDVDQTVLMRLTAMRTLFAFEHAPELASRAQADFEGFTSARGLSGGFGTIVGPLVSAFCSWLAPWLIGVPVERVASSFVTIANDYWDGIQAVTPGELLQMFTPNMLVQQKPSDYPWPSVSAQTFVPAFSWWVDQCNQLVFLLTDLARYRDEDGYYDPAAHMATVLSVERLIASTLSVLLHEGRAQYARRIMLFDVLEILQGLRLGGYDVTCNFERLEAELGRLRNQLPEPVTGLLLPRCERAVAGLKEVGRGFLRERIEGDHVKVATKQGGTQPLKLSNAVSDYLRGIRNATHSYQKEFLKEPKKLSLLASHDGEIPDEVSDLAALHLLQIMADPARLFR